MRKVIKEIPGLKPTAWFSPSVRFGDIVATAGITGIDQSTGDIIEGGLEAQIRQIYKLITEVLEPHGASLDDIVKMTIYFTDRKNQWPIFEKIRREIFKKDPPATTGIGVVEVGKEGLIEMDAFAVIPSKK